MTVDPAVTLELLELVRRARSYVRIRRGIAGADTIDGYVLAAGAEWTLVADVTNVELDGYHAIRTPDVERVTVTVGREAFDTRALKAYGQWPPPPPERVGLGSLREVLDMASAHAPVVHLETEEATPDEAYLGRVVRVTDDTVLLLGISPHAEWDEEPFEFKAGDVTRVVFGGRYERAVHVLGGDPT